MSTPCSVWPTRFRCWSTAVSLRRARRRKYGGTRSSCGLISAKVRPGHERGVTAARAAASAGAVLRVRPQPGPVRGRPDGSRGRDPRAAGAQRHGQDDPGAFGNRADQAGAGAQRVRRAIDHGRRAAPGRARGHRTGARRPAGILKPERAGTSDRIPSRRDRAFAALTPERLFELFPRLAERRAHMGGQLSGGEQQMLAIARALVTNPRLLILDEATEGLAPLVREEVWRVLATLRQAGHAMLVIDKYVHRLIGIADRHV